MRSDINLCFALCMITLSPCMAENRIDMEGITVIGNKESPNQLYIVPWDSEHLDHEMEAELPADFLDESLSPLDRKVLLRKLSRKNE